MAAAKLGQLRSTRVLLLRLALLCAALVLACVPQASATPLTKRLHAAEAIPPVPDHELLDALHDAPPALGHGLATPQNQYHGRPPVQQPPLDPQAVASVLRQLSQALGLAGGHNAAAWQEVPKHAAHMEAYLRVVEGWRALQLLRELVQGDNLLGAILELVEFAEFLDPQDFARWAAAAEGAPLAVDRTRLHRAGSQRQHMRRRFGSGSARQLWQATTHSNFTAAALPRHTHRHGRRRRFSGGGRQLWQATILPTRTAATPPAQPPASPPRKSPPAKAAPPSKAKPKPSKHKPNQPPPPPPSPSTRPRSKRPPKTSTTSPKSPPPKPKPTPRPTPAPTPKTAPTPKPIRPTLKRPTPTR